MSTDTAAPEATPLADKGLKPGALGLISSTVIGVASTAPAYSLAATLGFVVVIIGPQSPIVTVLAFIPMLLISFAYKEMNNADPDCGTTFTWAARAFGPGPAGWVVGDLAADILVMASLAQIAGQYVFLALRRQRHRLGRFSGWVLLVGILWIVAMTYICTRDRDIGQLPKALPRVELTMLLVLSVVALVKVGNRHRPPVGTSPRHGPGSTRSILEPFGIHQRLSR